MKSKGFTLIELIMVIIVIGILSLAISAKLPGGTMSLNGQAEQLANDIRYTQMLSMTQNQRYYWIRLSSNTYQIRNAAGTAARLSQGNTTVTLDDNISFGTLTNLPNSLVAFDGKGEPYTTTTLPGTSLSSTATIPISISGETLTLSITPETGRVTIS